MTNTQQYINQEALHTRCLGILEMIKKFIARFDEAKDKLRDFEKAKWDSPLKLYYTKCELEERVEAIPRYICRLERAYEKTLSKLLYRPAQISWNPLTLKEPLDKDTINKFLIEFQKEPIVIFDAPVLSLVEPCNYGYEELNSHKPDITNHQSIFHGTPNSSGPSQNIPGYC